MNVRLECSPSLKHKLKHTLLCGCFKHHSVDYDHLPNDGSPTSHHQHNNHRLTRTSSAGGGGGSGGMRSSRSEEFLNLKHKCRSLMTRMGTSTPRGHHRKSQSTDFRYDPLSYSLNFDEDDTLVDDYPYRNFSSRLPPSPPPEPPTRSISDGALDKAATSHQDETSSTSTTLTTPPPPRVITAKKEMKCLC
uniref:Uncharacterized protein n=1 Tax=Chenopodium quinoa TaxID=63459 RepID=A0A803N6U1_CHEQI